jgi:cytochrome P450
MTSTLPKPSQPMATPSGYPLIGHALNYRLDPLKFYTRCAQEYGDFVQLHFGPHPVYFLNNPDLIKEVFVTKASCFMERAEGREVRFFDPLFGNGLATSHGSFWQRQRKLVQPAFHRNRLTHYGNLAVELTQQAIASWRTHPVPDLKAEMARLSREIITAIALGKENAAQSTCLAEVITAAITEYDRRNQNWLLAVLPETIPTPGNLRYQHATQQLNQLLYPLIKARREAGDDHGDILSMLLQVRDEDGVGMSDVEVRDELVGLCAAHDSMSEFFAWAWWLIAQYPTVEETLKIEWELVLAGQAPTAEDVAKLRYTEAVVKEVLRLYPLAWVTGRVVTQDCELGGYPIKAGENVVMCQWVTHRDRRFFEQPDTFKPDRWITNDAKQIPTYAYFPFGGGPRICIGRGLMMMEAVLLLATIGQQFQVHPLPGQRVEPYPNPSFSLRPKYGLAMELGVR